jgi:phenylpyruvate tautomerase PptA (4-oxalocrotonate tautomerase family)
MPIVDVCFVEPGSTVSSLPTAQQLADAIGRALASEPGSTWVRLQALDRAQYAENDLSPGDVEPPVFVTVLLANPPADSALAAQALLVTEAVARCFGRPAERVHVEYAPAGAGRMAFGGRLAR